jgi:hypothetical protein
MSPTLPAKMYLGECPVFMIMLIGRWSSDAFLLYIRKQVMEFSQNMAKKMLSCQNFRHIPDIHLRIPTNDPHIWNHPAKAKMRRNAGGDSHRRVKLPPFAQFSPSSWSIIDGGNTSESLIQDRGRGFSNRLLEHWFQTQPVQQVYIWMQIYSILFIFHSILYVLHSISSTSDERRILVLRLPTHHV